MIGLDAITGLFSGAGKIIDAVHTSDEERLRLKNKFAELQATVLQNALDYERALTESKAKIITAEATGKSWIQRNWRPLTMLTFLGLVVLDSFGWLENRLAEQAWTLLQIGLGGYVVGRSAEKIAGPVLDTIKQYKK